MTTFKTRAEITSASEFIQYLEQLKSGSLLSGEGINRSLERLAENANALSEAVRQTWLTGGGTVSLTGLTFSWSGALILRFPSELGGASFNTVSAGSIGLGTSTVLYVILDRATNGAVISLNTAPTWTAFITAVTGAADRLDYVPIAFYELGSGLHFLNGQVLRPGYAFTAGFATDTQYGQQTELTLVHDNQKENLKIFLTGGGDISWDEGATTITFGDDLGIEFPSSTGSNRILANSFVVPAGNALYVTLSRTPAGIVNLTPSVASLAGGVPTTDNTFVVGLHKTSDGRFYLWDGTALSDGETVKLGGVRLGVQFYYQAEGLGVNTQIYDLTTLVGGATEYRVTSGELMVYRNGRKATPSKAYWEGTYPTGSLNVSLGGLSSRDDYVEEDADGVGGALTGNRILWLREDPTPLGGSLTANEISTSLYFAAGTFPSNLEQTFPQSDDLVEIFVGTQGAGASTTIPDGLYGFEKVWTQGADTVRTKGGVVVAQGVQYRSTTTALEVVLDGTASPPTVYPGDVIPDGGWTFIYLGPAAGGGGPPDIRISSSAPNDSTTGPGVHPSDSRYKFLTSAYVKVGRAAFRAFVKAGSWVHMDQNATQNLVSAFAGAVTGNFKNIDIGAFIPSTAVGGVRVQLNVATTGTPSAGDRVTMDIKQTGSSWTSLSLAAIKPGNTADTQFEFEAVTVDGTFDVRFSATDFSAVASGLILGYSEGRFTSGGLLGV